MRVQMQGVVVAELLSALALATLAPEWQLVAQAYSAQVRPTQPGEGQDPPRLHNLLKAFSFQLQLFRRAACLPPLLGPKN
ncbi:hypothetical protein D9M69_598130 [compost metagenome]